MISLSVKKSLLSKIETMKELSPKALGELTHHRGIIQKMVEIVNEEIQAFNQLSPHSTEKLMKASDIQNAQVVILNKKYEFILTHLQDVYQRLDLMTQVLETLTQES